MYDISFYCDNIHQTVGELRQRGVEFTDKVSDQGYGLVTHFKMPGGVEALDALGEAGLIQEIKCLPVRPDGWPTNLAG